MTFEMATSYHDTHVILIMLGRTSSAVYFEIRRIKRSVEGGKTVGVKRSRDEEFPSPPQTPVKAEPRPVRAVKPSAAKRRFDEVVKSGFWDSDSDDQPSDRPRKRAKSTVKFEDDFGVGENAVDGDDVSEKL